MPKFKSAKLMNRKRSDWYRIENKADTTLIHIYDEIGYIGITAADFVKDLSNVNGPVELHLNTPGGEVFDGIAIYNALKQRGNVHVVIDSLAASIGSVIAMAGDRISIAPNATMMIHDGYGLTIGNAKDMRETADLLDKASDNIASIYAEHTGTEVKPWRKAMKKESWYSAQEAVDAGLADEITGKNSDAKNSWDLTVFGFKGPEPKLNTDPEDDSPADFDRELFRTALRKAFK